MLSQRHRPHQIKEESRKGPKCFSVVRIRLPDYLLGLYTSNGTLRQRRTQNYSVWRRAPRALYIYTQQPHHKYTHTGEMSVSGMVPAENDAGSPKAHQYHVKSAWTTSYRWCTSLGFLVASCGLLINCVFLLRFLEYLSFDQAGAPRAVKLAPERRLAVVVPAHGGDLKRALDSLSRWPTTCSPVTLDRVELVLYYAAGPDDGVWSGDIVPALAKTGGRCFAGTSAVFGNLTTEVSNVNPRLGRHLATQVHPATVDKHRCQRNTYTASYLWKHQTNHETWMIFLLFKTCFHHWSLRMEDHSKALAQANSQALVLMCTWGPPLCLSLALYRQHILAGAI